MVHHLGEDVTTIGRAADNSIVLANEGISRHHAELRWDGSRYLLVDLNSKNGTWLNDRRLTTPQALQDGDVLTLPGQPAVELCFEDGSSTVTVDLDQLLASKHATAASSTGAAEPGLRIERRTAEVWVRGRLVNLTAKEFLALDVLATAEGGLVSKQDLAEKVWPEYQGIVADENIEQLIYRLRHKLEAQPGDPQSIQTLRGLGYRLRRS